MSGYNGLLRTWLLIVCLALLTGCVADQAPLTNTPTPSTDNLYLNIYAMPPGDRFTTDTSYLSTEGSSDTLRNTKNGFEVTFTLDRWDLDTMSAEVSLDTPLMYGDKLVTSLSVARGTESVLTTEDGTFEYELNVSIHETTAMWSLALTISTDVFVTAYHGGGVMLWLDTVSWDDNPRAYRMTINGDADSRITGSYVIEDDTMTLTEDANLAKLVFRRKGQTWQYDAAASAQHPMSLMPIFADGTVLNFGHAYEIEQGSTYTYRVKDGDGNILLAENDVDGFADIAPSSPTRLCIKKHRPQTETQWRYIDTVTGKCSASYYNVVASNAKEILYLENGKLVIEDPLTPQSKQTPDFGNIVAKSVSFAMLTEEELTIRYTDVKGNTRIGAWNRQSGDEITRPLLIVDAGRGVHHGDPPVEQVLSADGEHFIDNPKTNKELFYPDQPQTFYSGVRCAAIRINGEYRDLSELLDSGELTVEALKARLEADAANGLATKSTHDATGSTMYRYVGEDALHAVLLEPRGDKEYVYVGYTDVSLHFIQNDHEN